MGYKIQQGLLENTGYRGISWDGFFREYRIQRFIMGYIRQLSLLGNTGYSGLSWDT